MSVDSSGSNDPPRPSLTRLLAVGIDRLRDVRVQGWFLIASTAISLMSAAASREGLIGVFAALLMGMAGLYAALLLARQMMTGTLAPAFSDVRNALRLLGVSFLFALVAGVMLVVVYLLPIDKPYKMPTSVALAVVVGWFFFVRTAFYLPALAMDDPTSIQRSWGQSAPYWPRLGVVFVMVGSAGWLLNTLLGRLGLPWVLEALLQGAAGAAGQILALGPMCYLYWTHVRRSA